MKSILTRQTASADSLVAFALILLIGAVFIHLSEAQAKDAPATQPASTEPAGTTPLPLTITAGHDTDPQDRGRPVILIANALKVTPEQFRDAFSHVHPAPAGQQPDPDQVRENKTALMAALAPLGVTDDRLNEVSNYYRYVRSKGELWPTTQATAVANIKDGKIVSIVITNPGAGYSSPPNISIPTMPNLKLTATLSFTTDFKTNGSITEIKPAKDTALAPTSRPASPSH